MNMIKIACANATVLAVAYDTQLVMKSQKTVSTACSMTSLNQPKKTKASKKSKYFNTDSTKEALEEKFNEKVALLTEEIKHINELLDRDNGDLDSYVHLKQSHDRMQ